jgi:Mg2+-importing ATPase
LDGFLLFSDPVKPDVKKSLDLLKNLGVNVKVLSGDSVTVTRSVALKVGLSVGNDEIISGEQLDGLSDEKLSEYAYKYNFFARLTPGQKYKIVTALNQEGHIVGFLGDGINDARR